MRTIWSFENFNVRFRLGCHSCEGERASRRSGMAREKNHMMVDRSGPSSVSHAHGRLYTFYFSFILSLTATRERHRRPPAHVH